MIPKDGITLQYLKVALRYRLWYWTIPFFLVFMGTLVYCLKAPKIYRSTTLILVQPQEVPTDYVKPTVRSDARSRLSILKDQVMSRPKLERIITKYDLYADIRSKGTFDDAVEIMRDRDISVEIKESKRGGDRDNSPAYFEISYVGYDPAIVRDVAAAISAIFIDDNLRFREQQAAGTSDFFVRELEKKKEELREKEENQRWFKEKYMGLLPEQMDNNHRILTQLQQHYDSLNTSLQQAENRRVLLQSQLARLQGLQAGTLDDLILGGGLNRGQTPPTLEELRLQLKSFRSRYSDRHPDVIKLEAAIAKLEKEQQAGVSGSGSPAERAMLARGVDFPAQLKLVEEEIKKLNEDKRETARKIEEYRSRIEFGPKIEQMYTELGRDYKQASETYQSLLQKKSQAELAENLERNQKGEQFAVVEPANLPQKPFKPDFASILATGFMLALSCGLGLAFLREYFDTTFSSAKELERVIELPVLVNVPTIQTAEDLRRGKMKSVGIVCLLVFMGAALLSGLLILWKNNPSLL